MIRQDENDQELIRHVLQGRREGYALLMERYQRLVYTIAYRMTGHHEDARDITQECFLRAYAALPRFRQGEPFAPWISRITSNLCLNWLEKRKREQLTDQGTLREIPVPPENRAESNELGDALQEAVLKLPLRYRLVFTFRYIEGHDCRTIAQIMELPECTVKSGLFRARAQLRRELCHFWHEE